MSGHQRSKRKIEFCETTRIGKTKHELTNYAEIAGHISAVYRKKFNNYTSSDMESLIGFLGEDKEKINKINSDNMNNLKR